MDKTHNITGLVHPENLPVPCVPISEKVAHDFLATCSPEEYAPKVAAEVAAKVYSIKDASALLDWLKQNESAVVFCPGHGMIPMLEAVARCAQGVSRIEHAIHYVYHSSLKHNLLAIHGAAECQSLKETA